MFPGFSIGTGAVFLGELAKYFDKHFDVANAISYTGISIGIIVMPLLTQFLLDAYGCRGALLILGGINLHSVMSGAFLRPLTRKMSDKQDVSNLKRQVQKSKSNSDLIPMEIENVEQDKQCYRDMFSSLIFYLDLKLFQDAIFLTRIFYCIGHGYYLTGWLIYIVPFAVNIGLPSYQAAFLGTCGGIGTLLGNIVFPFMNRRFSSGHILYLTAVTCCLSLASNPLFASFHSYIGLVFSSAAFGLGRTGVLTGFQIVKENIDADHLTNAYMYLTMAYSVGAILSGFLSGKLLTDSFVEGVSVEKYYMQDRF